MIDLQRQKENFKEHKATLTDCGNIKILDFKNPHSSHYRIRFLFEEDYCKLHISGDLGELIATNYNNMTYEGFTDFVHNIEYFEQKIDTHSRAIYAWDEDKARQDIIKFLKDYDFYDEVVESYVNFETEEEKINDFLDDVLEDFTDNQGIGSNGYDILSDFYADIFELVGDFGKEETGILELYMLAFELAQEQLNKDSGEY